MKSMKILAVKGLLLTFACITATFSAHAQTQVGNDIDGVAQDDLCGTVISMPDANTIAVGAPYNNNANGNNAGHVRVFSWSGSAWVQKGGDIIGEAADDFSGVALSMPDANTIAIGADGNDGNGSLSGHVRVYRWNGSRWVQKGADINGEAAGDRSGAAVCMPDANTLAIGAYANDGKASNAGHVRVYIWKNSTWEQAGTDIDGKAASDNFGVSVSMPDAITIAIGATDPNGINTGRVALYQWNGFNWIWFTEVSGKVTGDNFGYSVSMPDTTTIGIGAPNNDGKAANAGHVRVFTRNGTKLTQKGADIEGEASGDNMGRSVSMPNANTIAIGAIYNDGNGSNSGHARVYVWNGTAWIQKGTDIDGKAANDRSGWSVSMPDARFIAIGAPYHVISGTIRGHARVYSLCKNSTSNIAVSVCNRYVSPSGKYTWTSTGTYTDTMANTGGCDSIITVKLTIKGTTSQTISKSVCNSYVSPSGKYTWISSGTYKDTIANKQGCDSVITVNLSVETTSETISKTACFSYVSPSGKYTWTNSGTYKDTIPNAAGCDSLMSINLTIRTVDVSVTNNSPTLKANASGASYQWLDCNNSFSRINGATAQEYKAGTNGSYAVEVVKDGCSDTSACFNVANAGILENSFGEALSCFPNPTCGVLNIDLGTAQQHVTVVVWDALGQEVLHKSFATAKTLQLNLPGEIGFYLAEISAPGKKALIRVVKQ